MKMLVGMALVSALVACLDTQSATPDDQTEHTAAVSTVTHEQLESVAPEQVTITAHSDCGEMLYCRDPQFGRPEYKCYAHSGCTNAQIQSDIVSDCDYVCGKSACDSIDLTNCPF